MKHVYKWSKRVFWNNSKNIDIWILRKEQNLFRSKFYTCVPNLFKIDWEMAAKIPRWPPRNLLFWTFQDLTAVISRASSRSPCFKFCFHLIYNLPQWYREYRSYCQATTILSLLIYLITCQCLCKPWWHISRV